MKELNEKEIKKIERSLTTQFISKKKLSLFEKKTLKMVKYALAVSKNTYNKEFFEFIKNNKEIFETNIDKLDNESTILMKTLIKKIEYISNHLYIDLINELFDNEVQLFEYINSINSHSKSLKLHENLYEESVFKYKHGLIYLPEERIKSLDNKDFLDCGAYIGDSALIFEKFYNPKKIYCFEPDEENYNYIPETVKLNNLSKVIPLKLGVGSKNDSVGFVNIALFSKITPENVNNSIQLTTIDKFVSDRNLDIGLIKMDVEGYELEALKGAVNTIKKFKPVLLIAIYHNPEEFVNSIKIVQDLKLDYKIIIKHLGGIMPVLETFLIAW